MGRYTVPNFIGEKLCSLNSESRYHLLEGYGVKAPWPEDMIFSGLYAKVRMKDKEEFLTLLLVLGYGEWWNQYKIKRGLFGRRWVKRDVLSFNRRACRYPAASK